MSTVIFLSRTDEKDMYVELHTSADLVADGVASRGDGKRFTFDHETESSEYIQQFWVDDAGFMWCEYDPPKLRQ